MLLDDRDPVYSPVVGECLVFGRNQADHLIVAALPQYVQPQVSIKQLVPRRVGGMAHHDRRLDNSNLANRRFDLAVFDRLADLLLHFAERSDVGDCNTQGSILEGGRDRRRCSRDPRHRGSPMAANRNAMFSGIVARSSSSISARNCSSRASRRSASVMKRRRLRVISVRRIITRFRSVSSW